MAHGRDQERPPSTPVLLQAQVLREAWLPRSVSLNWAYGACRKPFCGSKPMDVQLLQSEEPALAACSLMLSKATAKRLSSSNFKAGWPGGGQWSGLARGLGKREPGKPPHGAELSDSGLPVSIPLMACSSRSRLAVHNWKAQLPSGSWLLNHQGKKTRQDVNECGSL